MGMKKLAFDPGGAGQGVGPAIERVAGDRATGGRGVDPDLVGAPGEQFEFEEGCAGPGGHHLPIGAGRPAPGAYRHLLAVNGMAADRSLPGTDLTLGASQHKGEVGFPSFAILELPAEFTVGGVRLGGDEEAGGLQIQPMDDPGPLGSAAGGKLTGAVVQQRGGQRPRGTAGSGVNGEPGGFVEDDDIRVFVQDVEGDGFRFHVPRRRGGNPDRHG